MNDGRNRGDGGGSGGGGGAVDSVNGNTGVVVLDYDDVGANKAFSTVLAPRGVGATDTAAVNAAIAALSALGGGELRLLVGTFKFDESINFSDYNNVRIIGSGKGTILQPQLGGSWTNSSFIYCEGNIRGLALAISNPTKGDTQITYSTAANAGAILAGDTLILEGTDANGLEDAEYHIAAANGNAGTGVVTLKDKIRRTMTSCVVTDSTGDSQNNGLSDVYIDGSVASDATGLIGLQASNSYRMKIERVWVHDFSASNQEAIRLNAGIEHTLSDIYISNCDSYAIRCAVTVGTTLNNIIIDKANINGVLGGAIHFSFSSADVSFNNVKIYNGSYDGMRITASTSACRRIKVNGLDVSRVLGTGFYASGGGDHQLINGSFADVGESAVLLSGATRCQLQYVANRVQFGARLASSASYNSFDATISNTTNDGVYCDSSSNNDFSNVRFSAGIGGSKVVMAGTSANNETTEWQTFTPTVTLVGGAGNTVPVYSTNTGLFKLVGKQCHVQVYLTGDGGAEGAGTGQINIALPIAAGSLQVAGAYPVGTGADAAFPGSGNFHIIAALSGSTAQLYLFSTPTTTAAMTGADQASTSRRIALNFTYIID